MTFRPRSAARKAAGSPPGPAPRTTTSAWWSAVPSTGGAGTEGSGRAPPSSPDGPAPSPPAPSSVRISVPSDTVSPTDTFSSATLPAVGDGTSIVALSDSSVMSGSSSATVSPGWTITSMTGTSEKSPMSGTWTATVSDAPAPPSPAGSAVASWTPRSAPPPRPPSPAAPSPAAPSSVRMTVPSETVSPTDTLSSPTVPAAGDGTSIVALSDSSVTSGSSSATVSPGDTMTSMIGTSAKSPMSGTRTSSGSLTKRPPGRASSQQGAAQVGEHLHEMRAEARALGAVDDAVVVGQAERDHQPRAELAAVPHRLRRRLRDAQDRDLGRVDQRREPRPADAAEARDRERAALHVARLELPLARRARQLAELARDVEDALLVGVLDDRDDESVRRVGGEADVVVALEDEVVAVERAVELRERLERRHDRLDHQRDHRDLHALLGVGVVRLLAERLEVGDVRLVVVGDVRDHHPVAVQVRAADLLDPRQRDALDLAELREVDLRPRQQPEPRAFGAGGRGRRLRRARAAALRRRLDVRLLDPALAAGALHRREVDAELAREPPRARAGVHGAGRAVARGRCRRGLRRGRRAVAPGGPAAAAAAVAPHLRIAHRRGRRPRGGPPPPPAPSPGTVGSRTGGVGSSATSAATSASIAVSTVSAAPAPAPGVVPPAPAPAAPPP